MAESRTLAVPRPRAWGSTDLMMLGMVLIWGVNYSIIKIALRSFSPFAFNVVRFSVATLLMAALLYRSGESLRVARRDVLAVVLLALAGHGIYQIFFIAGLARTTPANAAMLLASMPIFVAVYGQVFGIERANRTIWAGILLSFLGIIVLVLGGGRTFSLAGGALAGNLMTLCAAMLWAAYSTISKPLLVRYSPLKISTLQMVIGTPVLIAAGIPSLAGQSWHLVPLGAWAAVLYSAVPATVLAYILWSTGVQRAGNTRTAVYSNVTPIVAAGAAWLLLGDRLYPGQIVGAAIVLAGLLLTRRGRTR